MALSPKTCIGPTLTKAAVFGPLCMQEGALADRQVRI